MGGHTPPEGFNHGLLFLLPKKLTGLVSDTRPLSVTNTDNRLLAATVARAIMPSVVDLINPSQKGFLAGVNGSDHIVDINTFFYDAIKNKWDRLLFLLDMVKALTPSITTGSTTSWPKQNFPPGCKIL